MSTNAEVAGQGGLDWLKWLVVAALVGGGIFANWYYQDESLLLRVGALLLVGAAAVLVAMQTVRGGATWSLLKEARSEIRRVVWPTRQETTQTTLVVLALVVFFAFVLWLLDTGLSYLVTRVIG